MGEPRCSASLAAISGVVGKDVLYCRSFPETPAPGMGEWSGRTGRLSGIGKFDEIENLGIILFLCKISAPGWCRIKKEVYHVNYCIILTRLIELLIVMFS